MRAISCLSCGARVELPVGQAVCPPCRAAERHDGDGHIRATQGGPFTCLHCCETYMPAYPCPLGAYIALSTWFTATHSECLPLQSKETEIEHRTS